MAGWAEFAQEAPELAASLEERFRHHKHCLIGTVRPDGSPRVSGIEVWMWKEDLWLGLMPDSLKGADLQRDPRLELHSAPTDLDLNAPDARLHGRAERVTDEATINAFAASLPFGGEPPHHMELYRVDVERAILVRVSGEELVLDSWDPGSSPRRHSRR